MLQQAGMYSRMSYKILKWILIFIFFESAIVLAQDIVKIDGKEIKGKYVSVDFKANRFKFIYEGRDKAVELPIDNNRLDYIRLETGKYIFKNPKIIAAEREAKAKQKEILANKEKERIRAEIKAKCNDRRKIKVAMIPFLNDYYTVTDWVADTLQGMCYNVDKSMVDVLGWFEKKSINTKDINDYHIANAQKELGYDNLVYGFVTVAKGISSLDAYSPMNYIYFTAYYLDSKGIRQYLYVNEKVSWF